MELSAVLDPFEKTLVPIGEWAAAALAWLVREFRFVFQAVKQPIDSVLGAFETGLRDTPALAILAAFFLLGWQVGGLRVGLVAAGCLLAIGLIGVWDPAMTTLAIVLTAVCFCVLIGLPLGILAARNDRFDAVLRPILDFMQTIPTFVYLVPVVMLFGIGNVPGVIVTIFYALAPVIRLTNLGIRQVRADLVEAARAFGGNPNQTLFKIQLPLAVPTIMAGVNQTIMMSLAMTVIASMISVTGLGQMVLRGIGRLDVALATQGGLGIVLLAILIDRISQGFGITARERGHRSWRSRGPLGWVLRLTTRRGLPAV
jgi:glycine betaine/proline transport system permease protein